MHKFAKNLAHLRRLKKLSQEQLADEMEITKSRLGAYEESRSEPPLELLLRFSDYFGLPVDILLRRDLTKALSIPSIDVGKQRILFPVSTDTDDKGLVELVGVKASAGYLHGYADPEFIETLPHMQLPFARNGQFRAFAIKGDSMPPLRPGAVIVGRFVEQASSVKNGTTCVLLTRDEGVVYKRVLRDPKNTNLLHLHSDNPVYVPYTVHVKDILEIWSFVCCIQQEEFTVGEAGQDAVLRLLGELKQELDALRQSVGVQRMANS